MKLTRAIALTLLIMMLASSAPSAYAESVGDVKGSMIEIKQSQGVIKYAVKATKLFKAKKTSSKVLQKLKKGDAVEIIESGKKWTSVSFNGLTGFVQTKNLQNDKPVDETPTPVPTATPTPTPTPTASPAVTPTPTPATTPTPKPSPTPEPVSIIELGIPANEAVSVYTAESLDPSVSACQLITSVILAYENLGNSEYATIYNIVYANIKNLLLEQPVVPSGLAGYSEEVVAVCQDIYDGLTMKIAGKQLNSNKRKEAAIFTSSGSYIATSKKVGATDGNSLFAFGSLTVKSAAKKGTYYMQMLLDPSSAKRVYKLFNSPSEINLLAPVKVMKTSSGGGGGGGGTGATTTPLPAARLIIDSISTDPANPKAGDTFDVVLSLRNTSEKLYLRNIQLTYESDEEALRPVSGMNTIYIDRIEADSSYEQRISVKARPDLEAGNVKLSVSMEFEDKKANALTASQTLVFPVQQVQRIQLDDPKLPTSVPIEGDSYEIQMGIFNLGKTMLYNVTARALPSDTENVSVGKSYYIGNMEPGTSKTAELELIPLVAGSYDAKIEVAYETVDGEKTVETRDISFSANAADDMDYSDYEYGYEDEIPVEETPPTVTEIMAKLPWQVYAALGGLMLLIIICIAVNVHRKRLRMLEDDEAD